MASTTHQCMYFSDYAHLLCKARVYHYQQVLSCICCSAASFVLRMLFSCVFHCTCAICVLSMCVLFLFHETSRVCRPRAVRCVVRLPGSTITSAACSSEGFTSFLFSDDTNYRVCGEIPTCCYEDTRLLHHHDLHAKTSE